MGLRGDGFLRLPSSWSASFLIKVVIPCLNKSSPSVLACRVVSRASLDSITISAKPDKNHAACGQPALLENFQVRPKQLPEPLVLIIFPSVFPEAAWATPALGGWSKKSTFRSSNSRASCSALYNQEHSLLSVWVYLLREKTICFTADCDSLLERIVGLYRICELVGLLVFCVHSQWNLFRLLVLKFACAFCVLLLLSL